MWCGGMGRLPSAYSETRDGDILNMAAIMYWGSSRAKSLMRSFVTAMVDQPRFLTGFAIAFGLIPDIPAWARAAANFSC